MGKQRKSNTPRPWQRMAPAAPIQPDVIERFFARGARMFKNDKYTVIVEPTDMDGWAHLSIRHNNRAAIRDWRDFQRIKNDIFGPEAEGIELYPAESRKVDAANQYHLYVNTTGQRLPWGYHPSEPAVSSTPFMGAKQRPLPPEEDPDLATATAVAESEER